MRRRIFEVIELSRDGDKASAAYDYFMMGAIISSLIPLAFKQSTPLFDLVDHVAAIIFLLDYALRMATADFKIGRGWFSFILYPITPMAVIDLLAILPSFTPLAGGFRVIKVFRLFRTFRVFRSLKMFRYSKNVEIIAAVMKKQRSPLIAVGSLAVGYIFISALVIFNVEPDTFNNFFDAVYWATVSLTTMGYGDIYPVSTAGRIVTMVSSFVGIAIVALPAGIITAGYMSAINSDDSE